MERTCVASALLLAALLASPALAQEVACAPGGGANVCSPRLLPGSGVDGGGGTAIDPSLISCEPGRTAANMRDHLGLVAGDLRRAAAFYTALASDLAAARAGMGEWCGACRQAAEAFSARGYGSCGGRLAAAPPPEALAADDRFGPWLCEDAVADVCAPDSPSSAWCTAISLPDPRAEACPLCLTLDCTYGAECRLGAPNPAARNATGRPSCPLEPGRADGAACADAWRVFPGQGDGFGSDLRICIDLDIGIDISGCAVIGEGGVTFEGNVGVGGDDGGEGGAAVDIDVIAGPEGDAGAGIDAGGVMVECITPPCPELGGNVIEGEAGAAAPDPWSVVVNATVPPDQCLPPQGRTACNAGGAPDTFDAPPGALGSPADDLGLSGCATEGSPPACGVAEGTGVPEQAVERGAGTGTGPGAAVDCASCVPAVVWEMETVGAGPDCLACATRCGDGAMAGPMSAGGAGPDCSLCQAACRWRSETIAIGTGGDAACSRCPVGEMGGDLLTSPIRTVGGARVVDCASCDAWCSGGSPFSGGAGSWGLDCAACGIWCRGGAPAGVPGEGATPGRMEAPPGSCAGRECCGPPFTCTDGFVDFAANATGCLDEERPCTHVTQASLVTRRKRNAIPSPGGVRECELNVADLKDVCTVDGSAALGGARLDPCAVGSRIERLAATVRDLAARLDEAAGILERLDRQLWIEHVQGTADRSFATVEASARAVAAALDGGALDPGFQAELAAMVRFLRSDELREDVSGTRRHAVSDFGVRAVAAGGAGSEAWEDYCSRYERCGACAGESGPAGCLGPTSAGSYLPSPMDLRGRCGSTGAVPAVIEDRGLDIWRDRGALDALLPVDPDRDLFIDTAACFRYDVEGRPPGAGSDPSECSAACRSCAGVDRSHCHPHLGVCVCEAGRWWLLTSQRCWPAAGAGRRELACCERLFGASAEQVRSPAGPACTGPAVTGVTVDRCRSGPGACCVYGFEEVPVERACDAADAGAAGSCQDLCRALFDPPAEGWCAGRCADAWPACDEGCLASGDAACLEGCAPRAAACIATCVRGHPSLAASCEVACTAALPEAAVRPFVTRAGAPPNNAQVFAAGDRVEVGGSLNNTGGVPVQGTARLSLVMLDRCACEGERCSCREERVGIGERAVRLEPGEQLDLGAVGHVLGRANVSVQALVEVADDRGVAQVLGRSTISHVVAPGPLAVRDAYFLGPEGRTTEAYPGTTVTAAVVLDPSVAPVAVALSLVKAGEGVPGSAAFYRLDRRGPTRPLSTGRYTAAEGDVDQVVSVRLKAIGPNATVLADRTLSQQGIVPGTCGTEMTRRCLDQLGAREPSFPSTFVQVRRLALDVVRSAFMAKGGREVESVEGGANLTAFAVVRNGLAVPFAGRVEATVVSEARGAVASAAEALAGPRALGPGDRAVVRVDGFVAAAPDSYGIRVHARDEGGRVWLEEMAGARLEALAVAGPGGAPGPVPGAGPGTLTGAIAGIAYVDTTIGVGDCRFTVQCTGCSDRCQLVLDTDRCALATRECACECRSVAGRGAEGMPLAPRA